MKSTCPSAGLLVFATTVVVAGSAVSVMAQAQSSTTQPASNVPASRLMQGFPPQPDTWVTRANSFKSQNLRWTLQHVRELVPTRSIWRGSERPCDLKYSEADLETLLFTDEQGRSSTLSAALERAGTDGFLVLHRGRVIYERYFGSMQPHVPHAAASIAKSFTGLLATTLIYERRLSPYVEVSRYVPELIGTGFGDATIQQLLDMQAMVNYGDDHDFDNSLRALLLAIGSVQRPRGYQGPASICEFLATARKDGQHGRTLRYDSGTTEALAWVLRRVAGKSWAELLGERIWSQLGAEENAYVIVDAAGTEQASGGLCLTLRDLARFGEMLRNDGRYNGRQILPARVVTEIRVHEDREVFERSSEEQLRPSYTYHNQWFITNDEFAGFETKGKFGQRLYIAPKAEVVIAQFSSDPADSSDNVRLMRSAFKAVVARLVQPQQTTVTVVP